MPLLQINRLIQEAAGNNPPFPPTDIFNETWLLRVILDWFSNRRQFPHKLTPVEGARWFSEALLPSAFLARFRNDTFSESWTHADGVIGHFKIGAAGKADCSIKPDAKQFVVCEAKVFSKLSPGVKNARTTIRQREMLLVSQRFCAEVQSPPRCWTALPFWCYPRSK